MAGQMPDTAALKVVAGHEAGELAGATILGQFAEVPSVSTENLQG